MGPRWQGAVRAVVDVVLQPDPQVLWAPAAVRAGRQLLSEVPHDVVVATAPPFSALLVGARLARAAGLPLVLDYRDEWDISQQLLGEPAAGRREPRGAGEHAGEALRRAQLVVATTQRSTARSGGEVPGRRQRRADAVHLQRVRRRRLRRGTVRETAPGRYRLVYVGTLWALTDVSPLVEGPARLAERKPRQARVSRSSSRAGGPRAVRLLAEARGAALSSQPARLPRARRGGAHDA